MMGAKKENKSAIDQLVAGAVEAPIHDDQRSMEATILMALARIANSDIADLKYDLLAMDPSDFYFEDHRDIFDAIKALDRDGEHIDEVTVGQKIGNRHQEALATYFAGETPEESQVRTYQTRIVNRADVRQLWKIGQDFRSAIEGGDAEDRAGLVARLQKAVFDFETTKRLVPDIRTEADVLDKFLLELEDVPAGHSTGFPHLDKIIGGLKPGLFVLAAPPSAGKTTFVKQLADQVAESDTTPPVLFFTYEQSAADIRVKTLARLSGLSNELIKAGKADSKRLDDAVTQYRRFGGQMKIIEGDRYHTVGAILLMAQRERQRTGQPPVIVVDYLQAMPISDPSLPDRRTQVDYVITELRRIARDTGASIIAVSSMSRQEYDKAKMSAFKESGGIEYGADVAGVMTVDKEDDNGTSREIELVVLKNRHGRRGKVYMEYQMPTDHFTSTGSGFTSYVEAIET